MHAMARSEIAILTENLDDPGAAVHGRKFCLIVGELPSDEQAGKPPNRPTGAHARLGEAPDSHSRPLLLFGRAPWREAIDNAVSGSCYVTTNSTQRAGIARGTLCAFYALAQRRRAVGQD